MYLKKIEIQGFKSFADKTELVFEPGIASIVGPNGCGKTNVSDSIRWVLGEQSTKSMRAPEMSSVIFNGTEARKPSSMAEVTLILSNEDKAVPLEFNEIAITRRIYRDNESDYLINHAPARLKDVRELFMGTGIGTSAYSVMEQGKMDRILTSKPTERRVIFEEAAGITKYKARKEEALRKLESTDQNLMRISDIVSEIKRQMTSLERQAKQADRYRRFKEEYATLQIQLQLHKMHELKGTLKGLHQGMHRVRERLHEAQEEVRRLEQEDQKVRERVAAVEQEVSEAQREAYRIDSEVEVAHGRIEGARQHRGLLADRKKRNLEDVTEAQAKIAQLKEWIRERRELVANQGSLKQEKLIRLGEWEAKVKAFDDELDLKVRFLETKNNDALGLVTRLAQVKAEIESLHLQEEATARQVQDQQAALERLQTETRTARERNEALAREKEAVLAEETGIHESLRILQERIRDLETRIEGTSAGIRQTSDDLSGLRSRLKVLEELQNKFTGYEEAVKAVLQAKQREPLMWQGVMGVVADLLSTDQAFEAAVESILGSQLQSFVVRTGEDARKAVRYLKAENIGKASFLVLEDLSAHPAGDAGPGKIPSEAEPMASLIKHDAELGPVIQHLFRNDWVVPDWEKALELSARHPTIRFVTREGDRIGPAGHLKAGAPASGVSLLGRHRETVELLEAAKAKETALSDAERVLAETRDEVRRSDEEIAGLEARRQQARIRLAEIEKESAQALETLSRLEAETTAEQTELGATEEARRTHGERARQLQDLLAQNEQHHSLTQEQINAARKELAAMQSGKDEMSRQAMQVTLELDHLEETARRAQEEAERYQKEADHLALSIGQKSQENVEIETQENQLSLALEGLTGQVSGLAGKKEEADSKVRDALARREEAARGIDELSERVRSHRVQSEAVQQEIHQHEVQEAQWAVELRNIEEKLQVEHKVDLENPPVTVEEGFSEHEADQKIIELRSRIERLGLVNMVAVEEYDELSSRFKFLSEQRDDLLRAKEDLEKAIQKINLTSRELFTSTFAQAQDHFKDIFQRLFEGGRAELLLIDEGDVLESGIEIVARPPGKRLQSVSLLSGGEKALTAIALLFALFMVKPSPFCLMDEIDAPLDDVNVARFTHMLKEFSSKTQFLIITHNKLTMETADVLYGVTMEESGVSKIISARFKDGGREDVPAPEAATEPAASNVPAP